MKAMKILAVLALVYAGIVVAFESLIGYLQPAGEDTLTLAVTSDNGQVHERVLSPFEFRGNLYVAVNHWPRQWYTRALERPTVTVTYKGESTAATAVPVTTDPELGEIVEAYQLGLMIRFLTGFPPRKFMRLDREQGFLAE